MKLQFDVTVCLSVSKVTDTLDADALSLESETSGRGTGGGNGTRERGDKGGTREAGLGLLRTGVDVMGVAGGPTHGRGRGRGIGGTEIGTGHDPGRETMTEEGGGQGTVLSN